MKQYTLFIDGNPISYTFYGPSDMTKISDFLKDNDYVSSKDTWKCTISKNRFNFHYNFMMHKWEKSNHIVSRKTNKKHKSDRYEIR